MTALNREPQLATAAADPKPQRYLVFGIVSIALFMASVDQTIVATALGTLQHDLHARVNWSGWTITIYALGQILVLPLAGSISDQFGRKRVFAAAVMIFTGASLACGLATNIYELIALRGIQAIGGGAFLPSATGIVADQFGRERDRAIGLFTSIFPIGGIIGPILGGVFVTYWSWRGIFLVNVPIGLILLVLVLAFVPDSTKAEARRLDMVGLTSLGLGIIGVMLAMSYLGSGMSPLSPSFLITLVLGVMLLAAFVRHAARATDPIVPILFLRGHGFGTMNLINFLFGAAVLGFAPLVPLYALDRYKIHALAAGTLLTARAVGMIVVAGLAVLALRRSGYRLPMIIGFSLTAVGLLLMAHAAIGFSPYTWLASAACITGIGMGVSQPASNNAVLQLAPDRTAAVAGLRSMFRQAGAITGVSVVTAVIARSSVPAHAQAVAFTLFAVLLLCTIPLVLLIPEHRGSW